MCLRYFSWKNNKNIIWHNQIGRCYAKKINSGIVKNLTKFKAIYLDLGWYSWLKILVKIPYLPSKYSKKVLYLLVYQIVPSKYGKLLLHAMYHDTLVSPFFIFNHFLGKQFYQTSYRKSRLSPEFPLTK